MTELPQTAREQAIAIIREARKVYENHAGDGAWIAMEQAYAKLIESALSRSSDETAHNVRDATIKEIARYLDEEGHGIPAEKVRFMGPAVTRPHQPGEA